MSYGGLMSYGALNPRDLPVEQATKFEFAINRHLSPRRLSRSQSGQERLLDHAEVKWREFRLKLSLRLKPHI
jgi:hypothetical protein